MPVSVAILKENLPGERRVALVPEIVQKLQALGGFTFRLQQDAGAGAGFPDSEYEDVQVFADFESTVADSDIVLLVNPPKIEEANLLPVGSLLATSLVPHANLELMQVLVERRISGLALELMPRISRAQAMNITSSQGTIAGYKAALLAAELSPRLWPMVTTPAGTIKPSTVVVIGAGIAGLQAIATARRLGARVEAYDIRPNASEQVESLGASMIETGIDVQGTGGHGRALTEEEKETQRDVLADVLTRAHAVICTAALPGRSAPLIVTTDMVEGMPRGGIVIDIAARSGGNCELTEAGRTVWHGDKRIVGSVDLAGAASVHSSELYARNMFHMLKFLTNEQGLNLDLKDRILAEILLTHDGHVIHESTAEHMGVEHVYVATLIKPDDDSASAAADGREARSGQTSKSNASSTNKRADMSLDTSADWVETDDDSPVGNSTKPSDK